MKSCHKCKELKDLTEFYSNKAMKDGLCNYCKICHNLYKQEYAEKHNMYSKKSHSKNYEKNRDSILLRVSAYRSKNKEKLNEKRRQRYQSNKAKEITKNTEYKKNRKKTDISYRISENLRTRLYLALKNNQKKGSAIKDLGCSISDFRKYLEVKFTVNMSWENYGKWHIDHIKPLSSFDLTKEEQVKQACHYSNLQPLWAVDNLKKGNREK